MRVIAGLARGLKLRTPCGDEVRPTSGRVRTSLFSILGDGVSGARVVDLFAGCGALGIEALSRGAAFCCFVEAARPALEALADNLARARLADRAEVLRHDAFRVVPLLAERPAFDLVFLDPPYRLLRQRPDGTLALIVELAASPALSPTALIVVQHPTRTPLPSVVGPLAAADTRVYGATALTFLERPPTADAGLPPPPAGPA